jgi:hypothetical protein
MKRCPCHQHNRSCSSAQQRQRLTKALQKLVAPVLKDKAASFYPGTQPNTILFLASNHSVSLPVAVVDYTHLRVLSIIVALPYGGRKSLSQINIQNRNGLGKWLVDGDGDLAYVLELLYTRRTRPACFAHALILALGSVVERKLSTPEMRIPSGDVRRPRGGKNHGFLSSGQTETVRWKQVCYRTGTRTKTKRKDG